MSNLEFFLFIILFFLIGFFIPFFYYQKKIRIVVLSLEKEKVAYQLLKEQNLLSEKNARDTDEIKKSMVESFRAISFEALEANSNALLGRAKHSFDQYHERSKEFLVGQKTTLSEMVKPLKESLDKVDGNVLQLEKSRLKAYELLHHEINALQVSEEALRRETHKLSKALHAPTSRGKWGEVQLRRVVELAGMLKHCDFYEQVGGVSNEIVVRPDMVINLPGNRKIAIDAKVPIEFIYSANEATSEEKRNALLLRHASEIKKHIAMLGKKAYWKSLPGDFDYVVLFLPGESIFSAALSVAPEIIEEGLSKNVIVATPTTLIALLRTIALGWRQEDLSENAQKISQLGAELFDRIVTMNAHFSKLGKSLGQSIDAYNKTLGSIETRVLSSARQLNELSGEPNKASLLTEQITKDVRRLTVSD